MMNKYFDKLPEKVKRHIKEISKLVIIPKNEKKAEEIAKLWCEKERFFYNYLDKYQLVSVDFLEEDDKRGAIVFTYSGSILKIGPLRGKHRTVEYNSFKLRKDVSDKVVIQNASLAYDIIKDEPIDFKDTKIKTTSPVFLIGTSQKETSQEEEEKTLDRINLLLIDNFAQLHKELINQE
jgi:hypothetical protein